MPSITYDKFDVGLDRSKGPSVAAANMLRELKNAYITTGKVVKKRQGLTLVGTLEAGTVGLVSGGGKLNTFTEGTVVVHSDSTFQCNRVAHPDTSQVIKKIWYGTMFSGYLYIAVEYLDGSVWHSYLNADEVYSDKAWSLDDYVSGVANDDFGLRWKCTTAGTSTGEPVWTNAVGDTVAAGGGTIFTAEAKYIQDVNCPHGKSASKQASRIHAIGDEVVRFCGAAGGPRDWTTSSDAGFIPTGLKAEGSVDAKALGQYQERLVVFFTDGTQVWDVDETPSNNAFYKQLPGLGCRYPQGPKQLGDNILFPAKSGIRSITQVEYTTNLEEIDVGTPIDSIVKPLLTDALEPIGEYFSGAGQYWILWDAGDGTTLCFAYTYSKRKKVYAWAEYSFPFVVDHLTVHDGYMHLRSGDNVYKVDETDTVFTDDGVEYEMRMEMPFLDCKKPGSEKSFKSMDVTVNGTVNVAFRFDPNDTSLITTSVEVSGDSRNKATIPVEITSASIAPVFTDTSGNILQIDAITLHYDLLGVQ